MTHSIKWLDEPESHDYGAALSYLSLYYPVARCGDLVAALRAAPVASFKAKDIIRASGLVPLDKHNSHVVHNMQKIHDGKKLSPILLVRAGDKLLVADGWHRANTIWLIDEDADIPAKIAG